MTNAIKPDQKPSLDLNLRLICRDCRDAVPNIVEDFAAGDLICGNCGLVLGNRVIDTRSEWRTFANSDDNSGDPSRVGAMTDPLLGGANHIDSTVISGLDKGTGMAKELTRTHNKVTQDRSTQNLLLSFKSIQHMADSIALPKIITDSAKQLYKKVDDEKLLKGKSSDAIQAACIFIACREHHSSRTFKEICNLTKVSRNEIVRCFKVLKASLAEPTQLQSLDSWVYRFSSQLDIPQDVVREACKLCDLVSERGTLAGKSPISLVAACLYFVSSLSKEPKSAKNIADIAQCAESTLKNAYKSLYEEREELGKSLKTHFPISHLSR